MPDTTTTEPVVITKIEDAFTMTPGKERDAVLKTFAGSNMTLACENAVIMRLIPDFGRWVKEGNSPESFLKRIETMWGDYIRTFIVLRTCTNVTIEKDCRSFPARYHGMNVGKMTEDFSAVAETSNETRTKFKKEFTKFNDYSS